MDTSILFSVVLIPGFVYEQVAHPTPTFDLSDTLVVNAGSVLGTLAYLCYCYGVENGKAGTVQAIMQLKVVVAVILGVVLQSKNPNGLEIAGTLCGVFGTGLIVVQKNSKKQRQRLNV